MVILVVFGGCQVWVGSTVVLGGWAGLTNMGLVIVTKMDLVMVTKMGLVMVTFQITQIAGFRKKTH